VFDVAIKCAGSQPLSSPTFLVSSNAAKNSYDVTVLPLFKEFQSSALIPDKLWTMSNLKLFMLFELFTH
jgi:hypothetical protein